MHRQPGVGRFLCVLSFSGTEDKNNGSIRRPLILDERPDRRTTGLRRDCKQARRGKGQNTMKRSHTVGLTLIVTAALSATLASTASAITFLLAEWLINGAALTSTLAVEQTGELNIINTNGGGLGVRVELLCSGILDGTIGINGADEITELLNLAKEAINLTPLTELALSCTNTKNCTEPLFWAEGLPWKTELQLMEDTESFFVDLLTSGQYYWECLILGVSVNELCEYATAIKITNIAEGLDAEFSDAFQELAGLPLGTCGGRPETLIVEGLGLIVPDAGTLTASSEG
jgi:hypothetical protein